MFRMNSVSYTHLDVYKRQALHRALHGLIIQDLKGVVLEREQLPDGDLLNLFPVSYTHLDVYKRQGQPRPSHIK